MFFVSFRVYFVFLCSENVRWICGFNYWRSVVGCKIKYTLWQMHWGMSPFWLYEVDCVLSEFVFVLLPCCFLYSVCSSAVMCL